jgi:hypothetical protein
MSTTCKMLDTFPNILTVTMLAIPNTIKNIFLNLLVHSMSITKLKHTFLPATITEVLQTQNGKYKFQAITTASFCHLHK